MSHLFEDEKSLIINAVVERIQKKLPMEKAGLCSEFVRQFYLTISLEDLQESSVDDLYGLAVHFWDLIEVRNTHEIKIRIYNPDMEHHGWENSHTVIELICQDMSFLVDSLRIVLKRMGISLYLTVHMGGIRLLRDAHDHVTAVLPRKEEPAPSLLIEAPILMKIERQTDPEIIEKLKNQIQDVLTENRAVINDWTLMRQRVCAIADELKDAPTSLNKEDVTETQAFFALVRRSSFYIYWYARL